MPSNSALLCGSLVDITNFDLVDSESITNAIFKMDSFSDTTLEPLN
jgi:hypothetical protein